MIPERYALHSFLLSNGNIFIDSLDNAVIASPSLESIYLFSIFSEHIHQSGSFVDFYFNAPLGNSEKLELDAIVASYDGVPGFTDAPGNYLVDNLPQRGNRPSDTLWAIDGRKVSEAPGNGSGVPVYWSGSDWLVFSTDTPVQK